MSKTDKPTRESRNRQLIAGVKKHYANAPSIVVRGVSYTPAQVEKVLQDSIDAADATTAAAGVFHKAVAVEKAANATGDALYRAMRTVLVNQYAKSPDTLAADFGITLPNRQVPKATKVADAVAKRAATRKARHTQGPRQKASIKGDVPPTVTPTAAKPA